MKLRLLTVLFAIWVALLPVHAAESTEDLSEYTKVKFTWGAEMGGSVDLSASDMSSFDFDMSFGMSNRWIKMFGLGAGAKIMVTNSCRTFPIYLEYCSDLSVKPRLLFACIKGGIALNYFERSEHSTGGYAFGGLGINFARTKNFTSFMLIGYTYVERSDSKGPEPVVRHDLHCATIKLGIKF